MMPVVPPTAQLDLPVDATPVVEAAVLYARAGFAPVPVYGLTGDRCSCGRSDCSAAGKHPIGGNWQRRATTDVDLVRELFAGHRGNVGMVVGAAHVVVDIDYYHGGREGLATLPAMPPTLTSRSGSGQGEHRIFALAPGQDADEITNRKVADGVDIKTRTGQIVVAPSLHRSGNRYQWIDLTPPAPLPHALYERIRKRRVVPITERQRAAPADGLARRAQAYMAKIDPAVSGQDGHRTTFAAARALWGWIDAGLAEPEAWALLGDWNARCSPPWSERELRHKWDEARKADRIPVFEDRGASASPAPESAAPLEWSDRLVWKTSKTGPAKPAPHHENAIVVLRYHPAWRLPDGRQRLYWDEHAHRAMVLDPPWHDADAPAVRSGEAREWTDADDARLSSWIRREVFNLDLGVGDCARAVRVAAEADVRHPFRDWLDSLRWDGQPRLHSWLTLCAGALPTPYTAAVGRWWLISAVARTYRPGCKVDHVLILEGPQGARKSSVLRTLVGERWFRDTPIDLRSKDAYAALHGVVVVELAELESLRKADADRAKAFFTSQVDRFRAAYDRRECTVPRSCVFAGTVNEGAYLTDPTGNRRYWPVRCGAIDLAHLEQHRAQLWAEALAEYRAGARWWPDGPEEVALCSSEQEQRVEADAWADLIASWADGRDEVVVADVWTECLRGETSHLGRREEVRIAHALQALGYVRRQARRRGVRMWVYVRQ